MEQAEGPNSFRNWVGKTRFQTENIDLRPSQLMRSVLDLPPDLNFGDDLPPLWHWLYFVPQVRTSDLGDDGHPSPGLDLPDLGLERRMWAGSKVWFGSAIRIGDVVTRRSTIKSIDRKYGRTGLLGFVTIDHKYSRGKELLIRDEQTLVYRSLGNGSADSVAIPSPHEIPAYKSRAAFSPQLLFRYSALTFNSHRIHYDNDYARLVEGYEGLVVQGPFLATILCGFGIELLGDISPKHFSFKAVAPVFDFQTIELCSDKAVSNLWITTSDGRLAMNAKIAVK